MATIINVTQCRYYKPMSRFQFAHRTNSTPPSRTKQSYASRCQAHKLIKPKRSSQRDQYGLVSLMDSTQQSTRGYHSIGYSTYMYARHSKPLIIGAKTRHSTYPRPKQQHIFGHHHYRWSPRSIVTLRLGLSSVIFTRRLNNWRKCRLRAINRRKCKQSLLSVCIIIILSLVNKSNWDSS